jgi:hypothetical protein
VTDAERTYWERLIMPGGFGTCMFSNGGSRNLLPVIHYGISARIALIHLRNGTAWVRRKGSEVGMSEQQLRTCPFCGGNAKVSHREVRYYGINYLGEKKKKIAVQVICNRCKARGPVVTETVIDPDFTGKNVKENMVDTAVNAWNIRIDGRPYEQIRGAENDR